MLVLQQTLLLLSFCNAHHGSVFNRDGIKGHRGRLKLLRFAVGRGTLIIFVKVHAFVNITIREDGVGDRG